MNSKMNKESALELLNEAYQNLHRFAHVFWLIGRGNKSAKAKVLQSLQAIRENFEKSRLAIEELSARGEEIVLSCFAHQRRQIQVWERIVEGFIAGCTDRKMLTTKALTVLEHMQQMQKFFQAFVQQASLCNKKSLLEAWESFRIFVERTGKGEMELLQWTKKLKGFLKS